MQRPIRGLALAVALSIAGLAVGQTTRPSTPPPAEPEEGAVDAAAAKINNVVVTKSEVEKALGPNYWKADPELRRRAFRPKLLELVREKVEELAVVRTGAVIPKKFILQQLEAAKERAGGEGEFREFLREQGFASETEYEETLGRDITRNTVTAAQAGAFGTRAPQFRPDFWVEPTAREIRRFYQQNLKEKFTQKDQAKTFVIYLPKTAFMPVGNQTPEEATLEKCEEIREALRTGADFGVLAKRYSRGIKADEGGDHGWVDAASSYQKVIVDYALSAPVNELSAPLPFPNKTNPRGFALVLVKERVAARVMPFEEAQSQIREVLRQEHIGQAKKRVLAKLLEETYVWPPDIKRDLLIFYSK